MDTKTLRQVLFCYGAYGLIRKAIKTANGEGKLSEILGVIADAVALQISCLL